jgi:hypothetical protein
MTYEENAALISSLHKQINLNLVQILKLDYEYISLLRSHNYMQMIIDAMRDNPGLRDEWLVFLESAAITEPDWSKYDH